MDETIVIRKALSFVIVIVLIAWIVLAYLPNAWVTLPQLAFDERWSMLLQLLAAAGMLAFAAIQVFLIRSTVWLVRAEGDRTAIVKEFRLRPGLELVWTALPLAITVLLGAAAYQTWLNLP